MRWRQDMFWPVVLIVIGVYFLLYNLGLLYWLNFDVVWPVVLIAIGGYLIYRRARS